MERQQQNCEAIAGWLQDQSLIKKINYPGLPTDPGYALQMKQARGGGSLLSFETGNVDASKALVSAAELFKVTVSFGSTTSLISLPCFMSHASIPAASQPGGRWYATATARLMLVTQCTRS